MKTARQLLNQLLDQYENSIVSKEGSKRNLKQKIVFIAKLLPKYYASDGYRYKATLNEELFVMHHKGWIEIDYNEDFDEITMITLKYNYLTDIYKSLNCILHHHKEQAYLQLIEQYNESIPFRTIFK